MSAQQMKLVELTIDQAVKRLIDKAPAPPPEIEAQLAVLLGD